MDRIDPHAALITLGLWTMAFRSLIFGVYLRVLRASAGDAFRREILIPDALKWPARDA